MHFLLYALIGILSFLPSVKAKSQHSEIDDAIALLLSLGVPEDNFCSVSGDDLLPSCITAAAATTTFDLSWMVRSRRERYLQEEGEMMEEEDTWFLITHALCALACVTVAALAAGLTMGLLSLDPLMLLIKLRAGSEEEKQQAASILPIVKQHHLLLVTLLLLNSIANEALPLFLEVLVSPVVAVVLSVTLVLFGGEIIPSAIFTGPNKIKLASQMTPVVRFVMFVLWPIAYPISKVLDHVLHDDSADNSGAFNRGELSALVRIQHEERMASKKQQKEELAKFRKSQHLAPSVRPSKQRVSSVYYDSRASDRSLIGPPTPVGTNSMRVSIHCDEVAMVEGALQMKTKRAIDVFSPLRDMYAVPYDTILDEETVVEIYSSGFSRIPVYERQPGRPKMKSRIRGILMTKQLIVLNPSDCRPLNTLPLYTPICVSPVINLVDLLNILQTGKSGHLALVCARPAVAEACLVAGEAISERAGFMGLLTLEDLLEALLQEDIADEFDKREWKEERLSQWVAQKWKRFAQKRKKERESSRTSENEFSSDGVGENTGLLGGKKKKKKVFFGVF